MRPWRSRVKIAVVRPHIARRAAAAALLAWGLVTPGCRHAGQRPNLLLIVIDTLRADHLGCYGYRLDTSPAIDRFAEGAVLFEQAVAQAPWTRPSMATLMTGLYPATHGVTCKDFDVPKAECDVLPPSVTTLAEALKQAGYETAGIVANIQIDGLFGFGQGFDEYRSVFDELIAAEPDWRAKWHEFKWVNETTREVTEEALAWLERRRGENPFFLYLHYLDPHAPYRPPAPYDAMFKAHAYPCRYPAICAELPLYDGEIRYVDEHVGRLLDFMRRRGLAEKTVVVVTSDHGEAFGEHGARDRRHGLSLYENQLRVPLLIRAPGTGRPGTRVAAPVRLVDLAPTLLDVLGVAVPSGVQGLSLVPLLRGEAVEVPGTLVGWGYVPLIGFRNPPWKFIRNQRSGLEELYNLETDPGETYNLASALPQVAMTLAATLDRSLSSAVAAARRYPHERGAVELSPAQREGLRALGYAN